MGVLKAEPAKVQDWATRSVGAYWRAYDVQLAIYALLLAGLGLAMSYSSTVVTGVSPLDPSSNFLRGLMWSVIAVAVFFAATLFDYKWLKTFKWPIYAVNLGLLGLSLVIGSGIGGAARWIAIGPLQFQFSELAKILMIVVLASYLAERHDRLGSLRVILGACVLMVPTWILIMLQPDLGTSLVLAGILAGMLFLSGASMKWLTALAGVVIAMIPVAWTYILRDYQKQRLLSFLNPASDPQGSGYQLLQSQIAVGSGGVFGKGLTNGTQDALAFLPVGDTDFAFARLAEELGFIGAILVFVLFVMLIWRVMMAGYRSQDRFGTIFAAGIGSMLLFQLVVNVGMVIGLLPITGIPLPFITRGGASLISLAIGLGILQSINIRQSRAEW